MTACASSQPTGSDRSPASVNAGSVKCHINQHSQLELINSGTGTAQAQVVTQTLGDDEIESAMMNCQQNPMAYQNK
jgi:hypothetical protein